MQVWAQHTIYFDLRESRTDYQQASMVRCLQCIYNMSSFCVCVSENSRNLRGQLAVNLR